MIKVRITIWGETDTIIFTSVTQQEFDLIKLLENCCIDYGEKSGKRTYSYNDTTFVREWQFSRYSYAGTIHIEVIA